MPELTTTEDPDLAGTFDVCGERVPAIGVLDCDKYVSTYAACLSAKISDQERPGMCASLRDSMKSWRERAATVDGRDALASSCRDHHAAAKKFCGTDFVALPDDAVGVLECDAYLKDFTRCLQERFPAESRGPALEAMKTTKQAWRDALRQGMAPAELAKSCRMAQDAVREACK
jgi:hypothetical protein